MHYKHSIFPCNEMQNSPQYDILVNHANIVQYNGRWFSCTVGTVVSGYIVHSTQSGHSGLHSGQAADPSNDADRAIAERKTGAAIQLRLNKTLAQNAKYKSR